MLELRILRYDKHDWEEFWERQRLTGVSFPPNRQHNRPEKDTIISGRENVYPKEVEEILYCRPAILEATVIGIFDLYWIEMVDAVVVVTKKGASITAEELIAFCKEHLAGYKAPKDVEFVDSLPKNPASKILKRELGRGIRLEQHKTGREDGFPIH